MLSKIKKLCTNQKKYCTCFFEGWWSEWCEQHDKDYYKSGKSRLSSDINLFRGVAFGAGVRVMHYSIPLAILAIAISLPIALVMFLGVRIFGKPRYTKKQKIESMNRKVRSG